MIVTVKYECSEQNRLTILTILFLLLSFPDDDECAMMKNASSKIKPCHQDAKCINTVGSHSCECLQGFDGDGYLCQGERKMLVILHCKTLRNFRKKKDDKLGFLARLIEG